MMTTAKAEVQAYLAMYLAVHDWPAEARAFTHRVGDQRIQIDPIVGLAYLPGMAPELERVVLHWANNHGEPGEKVELRRDEYLAERKRLINEPADVTAPSWARWKAQDSVGRWVWFAERPKAARVAFAEAGSDKSAMVATHGRLPAGHDWRLTLRQVKPRVRPESLPLKPSAQPAPLSWDEFYLGMAEYVSRKSKDPSTQVGCVIVRPDNTVASVGFNGFPRGANDDIERMGSDREWKLARTLHAEMNAILSAHERLAGCTAYIWPMPPCSQCASALAQAGIKRVVAPPPLERWAESCEHGRAVLEECGVVWEWLDRNPF